MTPGARFYTALDTCIQRTDTLEMELQRDIESARMFRLLTKLGTVVDRTELNMDTAWSETGDRLVTGIKGGRNCLISNVRQQTVQLQSAFLLAGTIVQTTF